MKAIAIIRDEHRNLNAVLFSLDRLVDEVNRNGKRPDFRLFHGILYYLDRFLDRFHHPKETAYLFPALRRRCPDAAGVLHQLEQEHEQGEKLAVDLLKALSAYEFIGQSAFPAFRDLARGYVEFERKHAAREESKILPLAREHLAPGDWERIDAAFTANADPLFGEHPRGEFARLLKTIVRLTPEPYGFGAPWNVDQ